MLHSNIPTVSVHLLMERLNVAKELSFELNVSRLIEILFTQLTNS